MEPNPSTGSQILITEWNGVRDNFGETIEAALPLSFDRINEGQFFSSHFLLSRLPVEITWIIIQHVPKDSLGSLALVNRDCRQLARSRQFASVTFDYGDSTFEILGTLVKERRERAENQGKTKRGSLGACIREITVDTNSTWVERRKPSQASFDTYLASINFALSSTTVLPHLTSLTWKDSDSLKKDFFDAIFSLNLRHLHLKRVNIDQEFPVDLSPQSLKPGLISLYLDLTWTTWGKTEEMTTSELIYKLVCMGAPTLESLALNCLTRPGQCKVKVPNIIRDHPSFPRLRDLSIGLSMMEYDPAWLPILIQPNRSSPIRYLDVDPEQIPGAKNFFGDCGRLPNLEVLVWNGLVQDRTRLNFLEANPQIRKLKIGEATADAMEQRLLPLLRDKFKNLTSLSLRWPEDQNIVPQKALDQIAELHNLEQLHLSAGHAYGWRFTWMIDHDAILNCIKNLPNLRKLALSRDMYAGSYRDAETASQLGDYYESINTRPSDDNVAYISELLMASISDPLTVTRLVWEKQHLGDMMVIAKKYAATVPKLEWIYLGQYPMCLDRSADGAGIALPLSNQRDECWTYLNRMFGRENDM